MGKLIKAKELQPNDEIVAVLLESKIVDKISKSTTGTLVVFRDGSTHVFGETDEVLIKPSK